MPKTIGQQKMEIGFFKESLVMRNRAKERKKHVDKASKLSIVRQYELLYIHHHSGLYYALNGETELNLELIRLIDGEHMRHHDSVTPYDQMAEEGKGGLATEKWTMD